MAALTPAILSLTKPLVSQQKYLQTSPVQFRVPLASRRIAKAAATPIAVYITAIRAIQLINTYDKIAARNVDFYLLRNDSVRIR